jgi:DNA recombination protein RmuC
MENIVIFCIGVIIGVLVMYFLQQKSNTEARKVAEEIYKQTAADRQDEVLRLTTQMKEAFGMLSMDALSRNSGEFIRLADSQFSQKVQIAESALEQKKALIDKGLLAIATQLEQSQKLIIDLERDRAQKFGLLSQQLQHTAEQTSKLRDTTEQLRNLLNNTKTRGQWGERMAEDVLTLIGMSEGINYVKQKGTTAQSRPDFTFLLPQSLKINMDVKFPLDNYLRFMENSENNEKTKYKEQFLRDVKQRVREVTSREYINPEDNTLDYVLVFIPNESIYTFILENNTAIIDEALKNKVVLCSPLSLYAILAIIRQATQNFNFEKRTSDILSVMSNFEKEWQKFSDSFEKIGKKIDEAHDEFQQLNGVRRKQLDKNLDKINELRSKQEMGTIFQQS